MRLPFVRRKTNILDPIHDTLDPKVWDDPAATEPTLKRAHSDFIHETVFTALDKHGYDGMERWLSLVFTGSLTTYQYSDTSDVDISLFIDSDQLPEWSRAEMIGIMISDCDGTTLPGTPYPLQDFVVGRQLAKEDLYKPGLRSGYDMATDTWIVPPDRSRAHDVEHEMNAAYTIALENADKMDRLLRYEPQKAIQFWHQIHKRRQRDMARGGGDYAPSNVTYKMLANRGLFPQISEVSGEYIARMKTSSYPPEFDANKLRQIHDQAQFEADRPEDMETREEFLNNHRGSGGMGCIYIAPRIEALYPQARQESGVMGGGSHTWNRLPNGDILDATYERYIPADHPSQSEYVTNNSSDDFPPGQARDCPNCGTPMEWEEPNQLWSCPSCYHDIYKEGSQSEPT